MKIRKFIIGEYLESTEVEMNPRDQGVVEERCIAN